jgi:leucyl/phenylalanyl-tRNA--protein transferase
MATPPELDLTPRGLVRAYCAGAFPMGDDRTGTVRWYAPDPRGILPLDDRFHVPSNLARLVRQGRFRVTCDEAFPRVIAGCAARQRTWITPRIQHAYRALHRAGPAHSVEAWTEEGALAGGLYGVALGGAFFGESMFYRESNASKVALVHLVGHLRRRGYRLLDTQYGNAHLEQFGGTEIPRTEYHRRLAEALRAEVRWQDDEATGHEAPAKAAPRETDRPHGASSTRADAPDGTGLD